MTVKASEVVYILIALLVVLFNCAEIVLISRIRNRSIFDRLLLSLAFSDFIVGIVVGIFQACHLYFGNTYWLNTNVVVNIFLLSIVFSFTNLIAITIDRFLAVQFPIKHRLLSTPKRANICITGLWISSLICIAFNGLITFKLAVGVKFVHNVTSISLLLFGVILTALYCGIFYLICKRKMQSARNGGCDSNVQRRCVTWFLKGPYKAERSVFFTGCTVTISFIICTYPFAIEFLITQNDEHTSFVSQLLIVLNSLLNPFVYFFSRLSMK